MCDLFDEVIFETKLRRLADGYQKRFGDILKYNVDEEIAKYKVSSTAAIPSRPETYPSPRASVRSSLRLSSIRSHYSPRRRSRKPRFW